MLYSPHPARLLKSPNLLLFNLPAAQPSALAHKRVSSAYLARSQRVPSAYLARSKSFGVRGINAPEMRKKHAAVIKPTGKCYIRSVIADPGTYCRLILILFSSLPDIGLPGEIKCPVIQFFFY